MPVQRVSLINTAAFGSAEVKKNRFYTKKGSEPEDYTKLFFALAAAASAGIAAYVFSRGEKADKSALCSGEYVKGIAAKEKLPFSSVKKIVRNSAGRKIAEKTTYARYLGEYGGKEVTVECKVIKAPCLRGIGLDGAFAFVKDAETGCNIAVKPILYDGAERSFLKPNSERDGTILKSTINMDDKKGCGTAKTYKNGELYASRTIQRNSDGTKKIIVDYGGAVYENSADALKTIIEITPDKTRTVYRTGSKVT